MSYDILICNAVFILSHYFLNRRHIRNLRSRRRLFVWRWVTGFFEITNIWGKFVIEIDVHGVDGILSRLIVIINDIGWIQLIVIVVIIAGITAWIFFTLEVIYWIIHQCFFILINNPVLCQLYRSFIRYLHIIIVFSDINVVRRLFISWIIF